MYWKEETVNIAVFWNSLVLKYLQQRESGMEGGNAVKKLTRQIDRERERERHREALNSPGLRLDVEESSQLRAHHQ